jgi:hypothetical protein
MPKFSELSYLSTSVVNPHGFALTSVDWIQIRNNIGNADLDPGEQNDEPKNCNFKNKNGFFSTVKFYNFCHSKPWIPSRRIHNLAFHNNYRY